MEVDEPGGTAGHQHARGTGRSGPHFPRAQNAGADARRRHHREAGNRDHRRCRSASARIPIVEPFAQILGNTEIGEDCRIGACSIITTPRSPTASRSRPSPTSWIRGSKPARTSDLSRGCAEDAQVGANARIGNFVELKNTRLGAGAKANHLAYSGRCRDRREDQHRRGHHHLQLRRRQASIPLTIGKDAFVGSNSTLVAPLEIGDGSYIGGGIRDHRSGSARTPWLSGAPAR